MRMSLAVANSADEVHGQDGWVLKTVMRRDQAVKLCGSEDWLRKLVPDPGFINPQPRGEAESYTARRASYWSAGNASQADWVAAVVPVVSK